MARIFDTLNFHIEDVGNLSTHHGGVINGLSGDGIWAVGADTDGSSNQHAIRQRGSIALNGKWTVSGVLTDMGMLPGGTHNGAQSISLDGITVVGSGDTTGSSTANRAWSWTPTGGFVLPNTVLPNTAATYSTVAWCVNATGTFMFGESSATTNFVSGFPNGTEAAQWEVSTPFTVTGLGNVPDYHVTPGSTPAAVFNDTQAIGCSADGLVVAGNVSGQLTGPSPAVDPAFRWTPATGLVTLPVPTGWTRMQLSWNGVSADGTTIVGQGVDGNGKSHAFRWTAAGGTVDLPNAFGGTNAQANACSGDGSIVVGLADDSNGVFHAFWWRADTGMLQLPNLSGVKSAEATCCSTNGCVIGGTATDGSSVVHAVVWSLITPQSNVLLPPAVSPFDPPAVDFLTLVSEYRQTDPHWVERMLPPFDTNTTLEEAKFLDAHVQATAFVDQGTGVKLYGLWHLRGASGVTAWISGRDCGTYTVASDGTLVVPYGSDPDGTFTENTFWGSQRIAVVGYSFISQGQLLRPLLPQDAGAANGPALGKTRRLHMWTALFSNAVGVSVGTAFDKLRGVIFRTSRGVAYPSTTLFTGVHQDTIEDDYDLDGMLCWQVTRPYPVTISTVGGFIHTQDR